MIWIIPSLRKPFLPPFGARNAFRAVSEINGFTGWQTWTYGWIRIKEKGNLLLVFLSLPIRACLLTGDAKETTMTKRTGLGCGWLPWQGFGVLCFDKKLHTNELAGLPTFILFAWRIDILHGNADLDIVNHNQAKACRVIVLLMNTQYAFQWFKQGGWASFARQNFFLAESSFYRI